MQKYPIDINIKPNILYQVAKAAWQGNLLEKKEEIGKMMQQEFKGKTTRRYVANQIRIAMGLNPHDSDEIINEYDEEALMGMSSEPMIVTNPDACVNCPTENRSCETSCLFDAISRDKSNKPVIDPYKCTGDGLCIEACPYHALSHKSYFAPIVKLLKCRTYPVYASVAPAFAGQFGENVTAGKLHSALLKLGFTDMIETALFADLITMKEVFEFSHFVKTADDFMITSCCCPVWIKLIENKYPELAKYISPSVSPMIASGRITKALHPDAKVIFIGPCVAKKSEAQIPELKGAIDYVLTFQELATIFKAAEIDPAEEADTGLFQASQGGRMYASASGVSQAVAQTLKKLAPDCATEFIPINVDGIHDCHKLLEQIKSRQLDANFVEGMACKGGCIGGPGRIISPEIGKQHVVAVSHNAIARTPVDNPNIYALLQRLGSHVEIDHLRGESPVAAMLSRKLNPPNC